MHRFSAAHAKSGGQPPLLGTRFGPDLPGECSLPRRLGGTAYRVRGPCVPRSKSTFHGLTPFSGTPADAYSLKTIPFGVSPYLRSAAAVSRVRKTISHVSSALGTKQALFTYVFLHIRLGMQIMQEAARVLSYCLSESRINVAVHPHEYPLIPADHHDGHRHTRSWLRHQINNQRGAERIIGRQHRAPVISNWPCLKISVAKAFAAATVSSCVMPKFAAKPISRTLPESHPATASTRNRNERGRRISVGDPEKGSAKENVPDPGRPSRDLTVGNWRPIPPHPVAIRLRRDIQFLVVFHRIEVGKVQYVGLDMTVINTVAPTAKVPVTWDRFGKKCGAAQRVRQNPGGAPSFSTEKTPKRRAAQWPAISRGSQKIGTL